MTNAAIILPVETFLGLSAETQAEIRRALGIDSTGTPVRLGGAPMTGVEDGPVELTRAMTRKLLDGLSDKTKIALRVIATSDTPEFHYKDVLDAIEGAESYMDIRAVWAALTRRVRKICDDPEAYLVQWGDKITLDEGEDFPGRVSEMTHRSLRNHFRIE